MNKGKHKEDDNKRPIRFSILFSSIGDLNTFLGSAISKGCPEIFNTDQGVQFTGNAFTGKLDGAGGQDRHGWKGLGV